MTYNSKAIATGGGTPFAIADITSSAEFKGSIVRAGINYKFW